jgi:hypothetical protein
MASTAATLRAVLDVLKGELGEDREGGAIADTFERFDGEPSEAVEEHVAELRGKVGASVLVGFLSDTLDESDESGRPLSFTLRPSVVVVRRRGPKNHKDSEVRAWTLDAEALDDLYDAAALALASSGLRVRLSRGLALYGDTRDWTGRALVVELDREFPPGLPRSPFA